MFGAHVTRESNQNTIMRGHGMTDQDIAYARAVLEAVKDGDFALEAVWVNAILHGKPCPEHVTEWLALSFEQKVQVVVLKVREHVKGLR